MIRKILRAAGNAFMALVDRLLAQPDCEHSKPGEGECEQCFWERTTW